MPERTQIHLPETYLRLVQAVLRQYVRGAEVWAYGSRVHGTHHEASDLDLVLRLPDAAPVPLHQLDALRDAFSDSNLPILVQVVDWARIPPSFRAEIEVGFVRIPLEIAHRT
jgi:predicted nucleotidyltransferase